MIYISSFEEFITNIRYLLQDDDKEYEYIFRGCPENNWKFNLVPSIYRGNKIDDEDINFKEMVIRSPDDFRNDRTTLEKLVKMQHFGLPTRLLDLTSNPLVALYFASLQYASENTDGIVYIFKIKKDEIKYYNSDTLSLLSNLAKLSIKNTDFTSGFENLIREVCEEKPYFSDKYQSKNKEDIVKVFPVKVKLNNNRIVRQSGLFLIFGIKDLSSKENSAILPNGLVYNQIIIDKDAKSEIWGFLDAIAINENTLFPDLEHFASYLKK